MNNEENPFISSGGLSTATVLQRQTDEGPNQLPSSKPKIIYSFFFDVLKEPMVYLLLGCGFIYFLLGDKQEAFMLTGFLVLIIAITITQETKAGRALEALKELSSPRALVLRNGTKTRIAGSEVVREDILAIGEGDRVPADSIVLSASSLEINESILTGESASVKKLSNDKIFAGTTIVRGYGYARVEAIGINTQIGKIGSSIHESEILSTRLEDQTNLLVKRLAWIALFLCVLVIVVFSMTRHSWVEGFLTGISLAMAILPNELPAVLTIFFAMGAWRLSKRKVLTRKVSAIENLGSVTVLCVDKTGTLTLNQMSIQNIFSNGMSIDLSSSKNEALPENYHEVLEFGILASNKETYDPMEIAFNNAGTTYLTGTEHLHQDWNLSKEYPLSPAMLSITHAWKSNPKGGFVIGAKGAPEAIIDLCHMSNDSAAEIKIKIDEMASQGLRVIGVAKAFQTSDHLPPNQHDFEFSFLGLIGITDPIRTGIGESISECHTAGIRVIMLTGDYPLTASSIAKKIGLHNPEQVTTGEQLDKLSDQELVKMTKKMSVFSRVMPAQKLRLVEVLKKSGEIVAMTGDGVNDAPALKSANIGIAMGGRGTDVARESADIVLIDDDFSSITESIRMGRRVYSNIKSALIYLFAIHIPIAGISILPVLTGQPLVLLPAHIALLHLIIEPASSIAFEVEPAGNQSMKVAPRSSTDPLFGSGIWYSSIIKGTILFLALAAVYLVAIWRKQGENDARTLVFCTLIIANTLLIYLSRADNISLINKLKNKPNQIVTWITILSLLMLALALYVPSLQRLFRFSFLHPIDIFLCVMISFMSLILSEVVLKLLTKKV
ncbi:MAG: cation-translocating P-type ATPase [Rhizobacter sp.]|nr:cation-translocating P-type ATPase [Bacteriovorax sp.]